MDDEDYDATGGPMSNTELANPLVSLLKGKTKSWASNKPLKSRVVIQEQHKPNDHFNLIMSAIEIKKISILNQTEGDNKVSFNASMAVDGWTEDMSFTKRNIHNLN